MLKRALASALACALAALAPFSGAHAAVVAPRVRALSPARSATARPLALSLRTVSPRLLALPATALAASARASHARPAFAPAAALAAASASAPRVPTSPAGAAAAAPVDEARRALAERVAGLTGGRAAGGAPATAEEAVSALSDAQVERAWELLAAFEPRPARAAEGLAPASRLKLLALGAARAAREGVDVSKPYRLDFSPLSRRMGAERPGSGRYLSRVAESALGRLTLEDALAGRSLEEAAGEPALAELSARPRGEGAARVDLALTPLGRKIVGALRRLESAGSAAAQKRHKDLLDLFGLRADEFDRAHNEAAYLERMAAAKGDKARLVGFVKPGAVVDVGPAGGAVLELLEDARTERGLTRIIGLDASAEALKDLESRREAAGASWELVRGDAFELRKALAGKGLSAVGTVIFSSILHEIYSYVPWEGRKFQLGSVKAMVGEALAALEPGGRLIIRDGVIPDDGDELQLMRLKGASELDFFKAYVAEFPGRPIPHELVSDETGAGGPATVRLKRQDAMEFAYTLTWGPQSFPYEVREQYGVLKRGDYVKLILDAAAERGLEAREIEVGERWRSYLQPGYRQNLAGKLELFSEAGEPRPLPPSNMIIVVERGAARSAERGAAATPAGRRPVVLIPGDGIGPEVTAAARRIIDASGAPIKWIVKPAGQAAERELGDPLPAETLRAIEAAGVALKGPLGTPSGAGFRSINLILRKTFGLYSNYRPAKSLPGVPAVHVDADMIVMRENLEDLYVGEEEEVAPGVVHSVRRISYEGSERIAIAAFELARKLGRKKVTAVHKANIIKRGDGLFLRAARDVAARYPDIAYDEMIVDAMGERIARRPGTLDVLLTPNVWGDILSDVAAGVSGGLGVAPSATIGEKAAIFEAVHGTAEDIAGKGVANPTAVLRSAVLMLQHLGMRGPAALIEAALLEVLADPARRTGDLGGEADTESFTRHVIDAMRRLSPGVP